MQLLVGLDQALSSVTDLHHNTHLQLAPPAAYLCTLGPIPGGLHCHVPMVRPSSHGSAHRQPEPLQVPVCTQLALALAACPDPNHYMCVQLPPATTGTNSWPPQLTVCILSAPAITAACPGP